MLLATILENQRDGFAEVRPCFLGRSTLTVRTGDLRQVGDEPLVVPLDERREYAQVPVLRRHPSTAVTAGNP